MPIKESRLIGGTLKLGPTATQFDVSCQITNVRITSSYDDDGDPVTVLCGDTKPAPRKLSGRTLEGTFIQDWAWTETDGGLVDYIANHDLEIVAYEFVPDDQGQDGTGAPILTLAGTLQIEWGSDMYGGDVNARDTADFTWNLQQEPTRAYVPPPVAMASSGQSTVSV
jgi:hypothetical protein